MSNKVFVSHGDIILDKVYDGDLNLIKSFLILFENRKIPPTEQTESWNPKENKLSGVISKIIITAKASELSPSRFKWKSWVIAPTPHIITARTEESENPQIAE